MCWCYCLIPTICKLVSFNGPNQNIIITSGMSTQEIDQFWYFLYGKATRYGHHLNKRLKLRPQLCLAMHFGWEHTITMDFIHHKGQGKLFHQPKHMKITRQYQLDAYLCVLFLGKRRIIHLLERHKLPLAPKLQVYDHI